MVAFSLCRSFARYIRVIVLKDRMTRSSFAVHECDLFANFSPVSSVSGLCQWLAVLLAANYEIEIDSYVVSSCVDAWCLVISRCRREFDRNFKCRSSYRLFTLSRQNTLSFEQELFEIVICAGEMTPLSLWRSFRIVNAIALNESWQFV